MAAHRCVLEAVSALAVKRAAGTPVRFSLAEPEVVAAGTRGPDPGTGDRD